MAAAPPPRAAAAAPPAAPRGSRAPRAAAGAAARRRRGGPRLPCLVVVVVRVFGMDGWCALPAGAQKPPIAAAARPLCLPHGKTTACAQPPSVWRPFQDFVTGNERCKAQCLTTAGTAAVRPGHCAGRRGAAWRGRPVFARARCCVLRVPPRIHMLPPRSTRDACAAPQRLRGEAYKAPAHTHLIIGAAPAATKERGCRERTTSPC